MKLSLVVPCYNEEENIKEFYDVVNKTFDKKFDYEFVFINDGSKDATLKELKKLTENKEENIKIISFSRNFGKEAGMYAGLKESCGDYVAIIDADLQQNPKYVVDMLNFLEENEDYDSVAAYQKERKEGFVLRFFKSCFYRIINKISDVDFVNKASDFRVLKRNMVDAIVSMEEYNRFSKGIFSFVGFNTYYMPYEVETRKYGTSKWNFWKLLKYSIDGIVSFSTAPLRFATITGITSAILSIIYLIVVVIQKLAFGIDLPGYATIVVLILFIGGIQLFSMGIIGEYIGKNFIETKRRPIYITKEYINIKKED